jgi:hypothetical protein
MSTSLLPHGRHDGEHLRGNFGRHLQGGIGHVFRLATGIPLAIQYFL